MILLFKLAKCINIDKYIKPYLKIKFYTRFVNRLINCELDDFPNNMIMFLIKKQFTNVVRKYI